MSAGPIVLIIVAVIVVLVVAGTATGIAARRRRLRSRFGTEYDRLVAEHASRRVAEAELSSRERRVAKFSLRPVSDDAVEQYLARWAQAQERFVEAPAEAVTQAQALVEAAMRDRGYPVADDDEQVLADLSVEHAPVLDHFRFARSASDRAAAGDVPTEELRAAMIYYREMFDQLLDREAVEPVAVPDEPAAVLADGEAPVVAEEDAAAVPAEGAGSPGTGYQPRR